jgi:hypothetical protein
LFSLRSNKGIPSKLKLFSSYQIFNLFLITFYKQSIVLLSLLRFVIIEFI